MVVEIDRLGEVLNCHVTKANSKVAITIMLRGADICLKKYIIKGTTVEKIIIHGMWFRREMRKRFVKI